MLDKADYAFVDLANLRFNLAPRPGAVDKDTTALAFLQQSFPALSGENLPRTAAQVRNLINWQRLGLPSSPALGNYTWASAQAPEPGHPSLSLDERQRLVEALRTYVGDGILTSMNVTTQNMDDQITRHLSSHAPLNRYRQNTLLAAIGRDPAGFSNKQRNQLLLTALMLSIDPELGQRRNHIAGYDLYSLANAGRTLAEVKGDLKAHLVRNGRVRPEAVDATVHIMLASVAPEFVLPDTPDTLRIGSPAWVVLRKTVALLEESAEGSSRTLTYDQVLERAILQAQTPEQVVLFHAIETEPLLDWATMHGVIARRADDQYTAQDLQVAATKYNDYIESSHQALVTLSTPIKDRRARAQADLERVLPGHDLNEPMHTVAYRFPQLLSNMVPGLPWLQRSLGFKESLVDLHMSGNLKYGEFASTKLVDMTGATLFKDEYDPRLASLRVHFTRLKHSGQSLAEAVKGDTERFQKAVSTGLKDILSKMPYADRQALATQELTFYRVEAESINGAGTSITDADEQLQAVRGRYGFLIGVGQGKDAKCYEFFPMSGTYVERHDFKAMLDKGEAIVPRLWVTRMKSHVDGPRAGASEVQIRALRETLPAATSSQTLAPLGFFSERATAIADYVAQRNLVLDPEQLLTTAMGQTASERFDDRVKRVSKTLVNTLIPFKACYDDIVSGHVKKDLRALTGCATDVAVAITVVAGGAAEGAAAFDKAQTGFSRLAAATRAVGTVTNGLLNPFAGLSEPLLKAAKWVGSRLYRLGEKSQSVVRAAWKAQLEEQRVGRVRQMRRDSLKSTEKPQEERPVETQPNEGKVKPGPRATRAEVKELIERSQPLMVSKVDDALKALADPALTEDVDFVLKSFQGMTPVQARKLMTSRLSRLKTNAQALTTRNIRFMRSRDQRWVAQVIPEDFKVDKTGKFMEVNIDGAKRYYQHFGSHEGAMSNALIHELDHLPGPVSRGTLDFAYLTRLRTDEENAAGLLNLAKGHTDPAVLALPGEDAPDLVSKTGINMYGSRAGSLNGESTMTSVALLSQLKTDPNLFKQNRAIIEAAQAAFGELPITDQVPIRIASENSAPGLIYAMDQGSKKLIGVYRLMQQPPGTVLPDRPPKYQPAREKAFKAYVQEHLVF
ncbi:hypothetical protein [Pseudomonas sp. PA-1-3F]|uniref:hypothetical protein n=1 Tax=Pseudomonas sp. PA-1-3F TaxID=2665465 RepID=UPI001F4056E9|nr:hypothetical protein [Pseudomonas sp. PA-1-3F]MCF5687595.1 hypothetical protein [Pseudomonas sp. PA-1-3F]